MLCKPPLAPKGTTCVPATGGSQQATFSARKLPRGLQRSIATPLCSTLGGFDISLARRWSTLGRTQSTLGATQSSLGRGPEYSGSQPGRSGRTQGDYGARPQSRPQGCACRTLSPPGNCLRGSSAIFAHHCAVLWVGLTLVWVAVGVLWVALRVALIVAPWHVPCVPCIQCIPPGGPRRPPTPLEGATWGVTFRRGK